MLRSLQFYAHQAHNLDKGDTFFQDHSFLGDLYSAYESDYDDVIERMIGLGKDLDIQGITKDAAEALPKDSSVNIKMCLNTVLNYEKQLCSIVANINDDCTIGTQQLIGEIANKSEMRQYKIKRRLSVGD